MVKGTSRQVIVVHSPEQKLFEQAIFILKEDAVRAGITDQQLLAEAKKAVSTGSGKRRSSLREPLCACAGALATGLLWLLTAL